MSTTFTATKVYVIYAESDENIAQELCRKLEDGGIEVIKQEIAKPMITCIDNATQQSDRVLLLWTKKTETSWISFQLVLALERTALEKHMLLRLVLHETNIAKDSILNKGLLAYIPQERISWNQGSPISSLYKLLFGNKTMFSWKE